MHPWQCPPIDSVPGVPPAATCRSGSFRRGRTARPLHRKQQSQTRPPSRSPSVRSPASISIPPKPFFATRSARTDCATTAKRSSPPPRCGTKKLVAATNTLRTQCCERGLLISKDGLSGNVLRVTPPLTVTVGEAKQVLEILKGVFTHLRPSRTTLLTTPDIAPSVLTTTHMIAHERPVGRCPFQLSLAWRQDRWLSYRRPPGPVPTRCLPPRWAVAETLGEALPHADTDPAIEMGTASTGCGPHVTLIRQCGRSWPAGPSAPGRPRTPRAGSRRAT
jgi:hypothetical protein